MNVQFNSAEEILDYAIDKEEEASRFYFELAQQKLPEETKKVFEDFTETELKHKRFLEGVKEGTNQLKDQRVQALNITEETDEAETKTDMTIVEALTVAMRRELDAYRLYVELAAAATSYETMDIFFLLAQEEARHKLRLETEYEKLVESLV
jgi:rubrerythrin